MNLGQIYETVLGWAGEKLGKRSFQLQFLMEQQLMKSMITLKKQNYLNMVILIYMTEEQVKDLINQQQLVLFTC